MAQVGDPAPGFTAPLVTPRGDVEPVSVPERFDGGPLVLAFFPAAFTGTCTDEMCAFRDRLSAFEAVDGTVLGVSVDLPFALAEFRRRHDLPFGLLSDCSREAIRAYDVVDAFEDAGVEELAKRAVVVVDAGGTVTHRWVADDPGREPDYEEVAAAVEEAA